MRRLPQPLAALLLGLSLATMPVGISLRPALAQEHGGAHDSHETHAETHEAPEAAAADPHDFAQDGQAPAAEQATGFVPQPGSVTVPVQAGPPEGAAVPPATEETATAEEPLPAIPAPAAPVETPKPAVAEAPAAAASGRIALIVSGLGLSEAGTQAVMYALPKEVAVAFHPRSARLQHWIDTAKAAGHTVLVMLPMEPAGYPLNDPGPQTLLVRLDAGENVARTEKVLGAANGFDGVLSAEGDRFTAHAEAVQPVLKLLAERRLLFVDARTSAASTAAGIARDLGMRQGAVDAALDAVPSAPAIDAAFARLQAEAARDGSAIGLLQPTPIAVQRLRHWLETKPSDAASLAPLAAVVNTGSAGR